MKKTTKILIAAVAAMCLLGGCSKPKANDKETIRIGMMASSDVVPFVMMNENKITDKYGITVELETFTSSKDRDAAFTAGELDGVLTDLIGVCMYQNADFDVRITGITDGDFILAAGKDTGIGSIEDIKGKSIAISENTLIDYTLDNILTYNTMASDDVVKEIVPRIPDRLELLRNGKVDLGLMPEPFATLALNDGAIYLGSANEMGLFPAVSAFSKKAIDEKGDAIKNLYLAYDEAVAYINDNDISKYEDIVIKAVGYPEEMAGKIELPVYRENVLPSEDEFYEAVLWASERGLCKEELAYNETTYNPN